VTTELAEAEAGRHVLSVRCRRRGHRQADVYATPTGHRLVTRYDSGRRTRRNVDGEKIYTLKFNRSTVWPLDDGVDIGAEIPTGRCDCAEVQLDVAEIRAAISSGKRIIST